MVDNNSVTPLGEAIEPDVPRLSAQAFLAETPPGREFLVEVRQKDRHVNQAVAYAEVLFGDVRLHCDHAKCSGLRFFKPEDEPHANNHWPTLEFVRYRCRNCNETVKTFALRLRLLADNSLVRAYKIGELPVFGPPTPRRLMSMIEEEREYFLKGRRAEAQGMGVAAFAYYRRVVENQKDRVLGEIIKVASKLGSDPEMISDLEAATRERQFSKAVMAVKHGIPAALLVDGHNPLLLLHNALSEGLHAGTDEQCLDLARSVRVVMADLAERLSQALSDDQELKAAVARLINPKAAGSAGS